MDTEAKTTLEAEKAVQGIGNQALMDAVLRQRDQALGAQAQAEAQTAVLQAANRGMQAEVDRLTGELAKATANRAQRRAAR